MLPAPIEHTFVLEHERYRLVEWTRGGERRLRTDYAMAIAQSPQVIEALDGADLYAEAVARECLKEAPDIFWEEFPALAGTNGTPRRVVSFERVPRTLWEAFRKEIDAFLGKIFPPLPAEPDCPDDARAADPQSVALVETVPTMLRGRAE